jgi:serine/threonine-protein kinase
MDLASGVTEPSYGLAWDARGRVYFGRGDDGRIWQISPDGAPAALTTLGEAERRHVLPWPLPSGRTVLYTVRKRQWSWGDDAIVAHTLATGERKVLLTDAADARYVPTGHLVFLRRGTLFAVRFDAERVELQGPPVAVLDTVVQALTASHAGNVTGAGQFAIASTGTLAWIPGPITPYPDAAIVTVDRDGQVTPLPPPPRSYVPSVRLSPNGRRLAVAIQSLTESGLWLWERDRGTLTPLTGGGEASWPVWAPDGQRLAFDWLKDGRGSLAVQPTDGTAPPQALLAGEFNPSSWTPDGRQMVGMQSGDIVIVTVENGKASAHPLFETPHTELWPTFSPDGRWLAYGSDVSGRNEVYLRPYPGPGPAEQVSVDGGQSPAWPPNGKELFFVTLPNPAGKRSMMVVELNAASPRGIGRPKPLFEFDPVYLRLACTPVRCYDVAPDGQRFFGVQQRPAPPLPPVTHINLIQNWFEELKAKVPAR